MKIRILQLIEGARAARGLTVVIDVFRAMTVEAYVLHNGAADLIPVGDLDAAYAYQAAHPDVVLIGERGGRKCPGFDFGNSPSQVAGVDFSGKTVIHTTSAGTQGIANAIHATEILTGSLVNARAIADYLKRNGRERVSLVCMGLNAERPIEEDTLCAEYIRSLLEGNPMDLTEGLENLKITSGAKFFDEKQKDVFPEADFHMCCELDKFNFVLKLEKSEDGLHYMKKIDM